MTQSLTLKTPSNLALYICLTGIVFLFSCAPLQSDEPLDLEPEEATTEVGYDEPNTTADTDYENNEFEPEPVDASVNNGDEENSTGVDSADQNGELTGLAANTATLDDGFEAAGAESSLIKATGEDGGFIEGDCPFDQKTAQKFNVTCGTLFVPENREENSGKTIQLAVMILPAANGNPQPDPVIYLEGGPGGSAIAGFAADPEGWAQYGFAQNRDLVLFDQRGTGYSIPELDCSEEDQRGDAADRAEACKASLTAAGVDLAAYNTQENGADVADLAIALGYDTYNLLGISYGTRLALAVMRDYPEGIRSVVLDSPFPPNANPAETEADLAWRRFQDVFAACAQDSGCSSTFPNLEQTFLDTVDDMNESPIEEVYGDDLVALVQQMMFSGADYIYLIPLVITDAAEGNLDLFFELEPDIFGMASSNMMGRQLQTLVEDGETDGDAQGMYNSVMCHDEFAFAQLDIADQITQNTVPDQVYYGLFGATIDTFTTCSIWDVGSAEPFADLAVTSDIPTLVMVGQFDPSTPPEWGELTVETLPNGVLAVLPGDGHSLVSSNPCAISMMDAFFANPNNLDTGCVNQTDAVFFELR